MVSEIPPGNTLGVADPGVVPGGMNAEQFKDCAERSKRNAFEALPAIRGSNARWPSWAASCIW